eukprot:6395719-Prorocentrum_lima.AAC.1
MDDLHVTGDTADLQLLGAALGKKLAVKSWKIFGFGGEHVYSHLRRVRRLTAEGCWIKPNPGHIERCA